MIKRMFPDSGRCSVLGDMTETYLGLEEESGRFRAALWFWGQCLKAVPCFIIDLVTWRSAMLKNYLLITLRNLKKHKTYSLLNIVGLAVGLSAFVLIALYLQYELSFDRHHDKADRIYRVVRENRTCTPAPLGPALMERLPEVASAARIIRSPHTLLSHQQKHFLEDEFYWADPRLFEIFTIPFVSGDPRSAMSDPSAILLSRSTALKVFGRQDPIGEILTVQERFEFTVRGVFRDMPKNSHFVMNAAVPYEFYFQATTNDITSWRSNYSYTYALLREGADPDTVQGKIHPVIERPLLEEAGIKEPYPRIYSIQPIVEIHLHSHRMQEIGVNNDMKSIILFAAIAFLILFIACINYMNLATARSLRRGREVGIRKVVGGQRRQLVAQFFGESLAMTILATALSVVLMLVVIPAFNRLVERPLSLNPTHNPLLAAGLLLLILSVGFIAGSYPAMRMSGFRPSDVLGKTSPRSAKSSMLRNVLVLVQFSITIVLIICTMAVRRQLEFVKSADVGYGRDHIVSLPVRDRTVRRNIQAIKAELLQYPDISAVATSGRLPDDIDTFTSRDWTGRNPDEPVAIFYNTVDDDFVDLFGLEVLQGRNFSRDFPSDRAGAFLVNETAVRIAEWDAPIGRMFTHWSGQTGKIVGVVKDFHLHSLHSPIDPLYFYLDPGDFNQISIKLRSTDIAATLAKIEKVVKRFSPNYPFTYAFFDDIFQRAYLTEQRMGSVFSSFAILAVLIACLGLFGLGAFTAAQRTKEIGIRKVLGAPVSTIVLLLCKEFVRWVLLANLIAWPVAYLTMSRWLQNFAFRTKLGVEIFILSGVAALIIALLTVGYQAVKAAAADPIRALRYE